MDADQSMGFARGGVTTPVAMQLFSAILGSQALPVDLVAARCAANDGAAWSSGVLAQFPTTAQSIDAWISMKDSAKREFERVDLRTEPSAALEAFLRYCAAIAGALAHQNKVISSIAPTELRRMLRVIGPSLDAPWRNLFGQAQAQLAATHLGT